MHPGGYPQQQQGGYPYNQSNYPQAQLGFDQSGGGGYPQMGGYPGQAPHMGGYPGQAPQMGGYPGQAPQMGGYPGQAPQMGGYPGQGPPMAGGYPGQGPPMAGGYPGQAPAQGYGGAPQGGQYGYGAPGSMNPQYAAGGAPASQGTHSTATSSFQVGQSSGKMDFKRMGAMGEHFTPAIHPTPNFNAEADAGTLRKAMKGIGTDEKALISVLGHRTRDERMKVVKTFKTMYGKDLISELKGETSGNFKNAVESLCLDPIIYDAKSLRDAMEGIGTKEHVLTEIITTRDAQELQAIKDAYNTRFKRHLEKDVMDETSGFFRRVLVSCLQCGRNELNDQQKASVMSQGPNAVVDRALAQREAQEMHTAGEKKMGTDESCFIRIIGLRNPFQLKATFDEYQKIAGRDIFSSIDREMSGDLNYALKSLAMAQICKPRYFSERLHGSMKGLGTSDDTLVRVIVTRADIDLESIKQEFSKLYGKTLASFIQGDTSGDYRALLLALIGQSK